MMDMNDIEPKSLIIDSIQSNGLVLLSNEATAGSPGASSTASDSPTPTNSVHEKNWPSHWQGLVCQSEEQRQLLGTEEESSDRHSSDGEDEGDSAIWVINDEQMEYYRTQFCSLQPDPNSLVSGKVAKHFFLKSRLPIEELRKIWQLADVTKDGALSLAEFNTAMHLVVLRKNNIALPDVLPLSLIPNVMNQSLHGSPHASSPTLSTAESTCSPHRGKEWTKFVDSPTSSVSSPGPKPVNFDFHKSAVEQDPKILHPVPLKVTPGPEMVEEEPKCLTEQLSGGGSETSRIRPIQRPQLKKPAVSGAIPGAIPPPPQSSLDEAIENSTVSGPTSLPAASVSLPKKDPPPPPPPRPYRTHTRSSSLDLNKLGKIGVITNTPPVVPPRTSPGTISPKKLVVQRIEGKAEADEAATFADFTQFTPVYSNAEQPRAFKIYKKPERTSPPFREIPTLPLDVSSESRQEHNNVLRKLCTELQNDLAIVKEERLSLQLKLEQLYS